MAYLYLALAIISEVIGTSALKASEEFTRLYPSIVVVVGYLISFYFMTLVLRTIPLGVTYAVWSGLGIVLIAITGFVFYQESPDLAAIIGMALIILGVVVIYMFSDTISH